MKPIVPNSTNYFKTDQISNNLREKALRGASATLLAQIFSFTISMSGTIILARLLTPGDFGLVAMVLIFSLLLQNFGLNGFTEITIQRPEINHTQISTLFWINLIINFSLSLLFIAVGPLIACFYREPRLTGIIAIIASSILFSGLSTQHLALLQRNMEFYKTSLIAVLASLISFALAVMLAYMGWSYWALAIRWAALPFITAVGAWILCRWRPGLPANDPSIRPMIKFALNTYGNFVIDYFGRNIDKLLLGKYYGTHALGFYDRAYQLSNMLPNQLVHPMTNIAVAALSRVSTNPDKYQRSYFEAISLLAFIGMPASAVIVLTGSDLIHILLGPNWAMAGKLFQIFGISLGIKLVYSTHSWLHLSLGTPDKWFRWSILSLIFTVLCFLIGLKFGIVGITVAYSVSYYFLIGPGLWYAGKPIHLNLSHILDAVWRYYVSASVSGLSCWFVLHKWAFLSLHFGRMNTLLRILLSSSLFTGIYMAIIFILYPGGRPISHFLQVFREMVLGRINNTLQRNTE